MGFSHYFFLPYICLFCTYVFLNLLFQMNKLVAEIRGSMQKKPSHAGQKKVKYEYDSDEDTEGGTWEHKARACEMVDTSG